MIELIFAILCGGAGALLGGSAVVRSTLNLPGSPVQATLGGAISMIIVGFAVAWLASPLPEEQVYSFQIDNIPTELPIDDVSYSVFVGPPSNANNVTVTRVSSNSVTVKVPARVDTYKIMIVVDPKERDTTKTFVRCSLTFSSGDGPSLPPMQIVAGGDEQYSLYLAQNYIALAVKKSIDKKEPVNDSPCVEGVVATKKSHPTPLSGHFTLLPNTTVTRLEYALRFSKAPRYEMLASDVADNDPQDTLPDLAPSAKIGRAGVAESPSFGRTDKEKRVDKKALPSKAELPQKKLQTAGAGVNASSAPQKLVQGKRTLYGQIDAYVNGENLDRTQLYQHWSDVSAYVLNGFRSEFDKGSPRVARYLNLISNALNVIENGKYLPPSRRPDWDQAIKSDRLRKQMVFLDSQTTTTEMLLLCCAGRMTI